MEIFKFCAHGDCCEVRFPAKLKGRKGVDVKQALFIQCGTRYRLLRAVTSHGDAIRLAAEHVVGSRNGLVERDPELLIQLCNVEHYSNDDVGLKVFDEARDRSSPFISGNVVSNIQMSAYVRAVTNLECNGFEFEPGLLRDTDLKWLDAMRARRVPGADVARTWFNSDGKDHLCDRETALYVFFHHYGQSGDRKQVVHGWLLLDAVDHQVIHRLDHEGSPKFSQRIMDRAVEILTQQRSDPVDLVRIVNGVEVHVAPRVQAVATQMLADLDLSIGVTQTSLGDEQRHDYPRP